MRADICEESMDTKNCLVTNNPQSFFYKGILEEKKCHKGYISFHFCVTFQLIVPVDESVSKIRF